MLRDLGGPRCPPPEVAAPYAVAERFRRRVDTTCVPANFDESFDLAPFSDDRMSARLHAWLEPNECEDLAGRILEDRRRLEARGSSQ